MGGVCSQGDVLGRERQRRWHDEEKLAIVLDVGVDGGSVTSVAQRHEATRQQICSKRRLRPIEFPDVEALRAVLADPDHVAATTGAGDAVWFDYLLDARQGVGKLPLLAGLARRPVLFRLGGFDLPLDRRDLFL